MSDDWHLSETYKSLTTISVEAFKFCALANGGAAVAILSYLGTVAAKVDVVPDMRCAMASFLLGLVACGFAMLFSYQTQLQVFQEAKASRKTTELECVTCRERIILSNHVVYLRLAICCVILSICAFGYGSWKGVSEFGAKPEQNPYADAVEFDQKFSDWQTGWECAAGNAE